MVVAPKSFAPHVLAPINLVERRVRELLAGRDQVTFGPVHGIAMAPSKRLRAALALTSARAVQLPERLAIELAAAIEVIHTFSLVHDDIEDGADTRRGQPAVHVIEGVPIAINAGDALHVLAWNVLLRLDAPATRTNEVARWFGVTLERMVAGQARDLLWTRQRRHDLDYAEYEAMVRGKTGALLGFAAAAPAALVGHPGTEHLQQFGEELGISFQLLDDVAGLQGSRESLGKPVGRNTNGAACGPTVLAGTHRAIEFAHQHVARACAHLKMAELVDCSQLEAFARIMLVQLLART